MDPSAGTAANASQQSPNRRTSLLQLAGATLPGAAVFCALFLLGARQGVALATTGGGGWVADLAAFRLDPVGSITALHFQPPLTTIMFGLIPPDATFPYAAVLDAVLAVATVALIGCTIVILTSSWKWGAVGGVVYALLPSTVLFAYWPSTLTPTAFLIALTALGMALVVRGHLIAGCWVAVLGIVGAFLTRAAVSWVLATLWLLILVILVRVVRSRVRRPGVIIPIGAGVLAVLLVQAHFVSAFGLWTTSSWSGENIVRALTMTSAVPKPIIEEVRSTDPCFAELLDGESWLGSQDLPVCMAGYVPEQTGVALLDNAQRLDNGAYNYNERPRLYIGQRWNDLARELIMRQPWAPLRVAQVTLPVYLTNAAGYAFLQENFRTMASVMTPLKVLMSPFPVGNWLLVLLGWLAVWRFRLATREIRWGLAALTAVLLSHAAVALIGEVGENDRFHAETYPVLVMLSMSFAALMWSRVARRDGVRSGV